MKAYFFLLLFVSDFSKHAIPKKSKKIPKNLKHFHIEEFKLSKKFTLV